MNRVCVAVIIGLFIAATAFAGPLCYKCYSYRCYTWTAPAYVNCMSGMGDCNHWTGCTADDGGGGGGGCGWDPDCVQGALSAPAAWRLAKVEIRVAPHTGATTWRVARVRVTHRNQERAQ